MRTPVKKAITSFEDIFAALETNRSNDPNFWLPEFIYRGHKCTINARVAGGKYELSVSQVPMTSSNQRANRSVSGKIWNEAVTSCMVTNTRPAADIAREFERRIQWSIIDAYKAQCIVEDKAQEEYCKNTENIAQRLCLVMKKGCDRHNEESYTVKDNGPWHSSGNGGTGSIWVNGNHVDFCLKGISNIDLAEDLCQVLAKYQRK